MSRLMDVYGDGKDTVRMCIDATKFSNLGRFLNHSYAHTGRPQLSIGSPAQP